MSIPMRALITFNQQTNFRETYFEQNVSEYRPTFVLFNSVPTVIPTSQQYEFVKWWEGAELSYYNLCRTTLVCHRKIEPLSRQVYCRKYSNNKQKKAGGQLSAFGLTMSNEQPKHGL
jgi:hypothetical protein